MSRPIQCVGCGDVKPYYTRRAVLSCKCVGVNPKFDQVYGYRYQLASKAPVKEGFWVPRPVPSHLTVEMVSLEVPDPMWRRHPDYQCQHCYQSAFLNPYTNDIWGCVVCLVTTIRPLENFVPTAKALELWRANLVGATH